MSEQEFETYLDLLTRTLRLMPKQRDAIAAELRDHMEARLRELTIQGVERENAINTALAEFGNASALAQQFSRSAPYTYRSRIIKSTAAAVVLSAGLTFGFMLVGPNASDHMPALQAQEQDRDDLVRENQRLKAQLSRVTSSQMMEIGLQAFVYADTHNGQWPTKPSDLRSLVAYESFIAPYDFSFEQKQQLDEMEQPWDWIDKNSSFVFLIPADGEQPVPLLIERNAFIDNSKWTVFTDGHGELIRQKQAEEEDA